MYIIDYYFKLNIIKDFFGVKLSFSKNVILYKIIL